MLTISNRSDIIVLLRKIYYLTVGAFSSFGPGTAIITFGFEKNCKCAFFHGASQNSLVRVSILSKNA
jgi:hypothetical protein